MSDEDASNTSPSPDPSAFRPSDNLTLPPPPANATDPSVPANLLNGSLAIAQAVTGPLGLRFEVAAPAGCRLEVNATGLYPRSGPAALLIIDDLDAPSYAAWLSSDSAQAAGSTLYSRPNFNGTWRLSLGGPVGSSGTAAYLLVAPNGIADTDGQPALSLRADCPEAKVTSLHVGTEATLADVGQFSSTASAAVFPLPSFAIQGHAQWTDTLPASFTRVVASPSPTNPTTLSFTHEGESQDWNSADGRGLFSYTGGPGAKELELTTTTQDLTMLASFAGCSVAVPADGIFKLAPC